MEANEPLAFGGADGDPKALANILDERPRAALERRPELHAVARRVIAILEPLDPPARLRVIRAAAILLELDATIVGVYP